MSCIVADSAGSRIRLSEAVKAGTDEVARTITANYCDSLYSFPNCEQGYGLTVRAENVKCWKFAGYIRIGGNFLKGIQGMLPGPGTYELNIYCDEPGWCFYVYSFECFNVYGTGGNKSFCGSRVTYINCFGDPYCSGDPHCFPICSECP